MMAKKNAAVLDPDNSNDEWFPGDCNRRRVPFCWRFTQILLCINNYSNSLNHLIKFRIMVDMWNSIATYLNVSLCWECLVFQYLKQAIKFLHMKIWLIQLSRQIEIRSRFSDFWANRLNKLIWKSTKLNWYVCYLTKFIQIQKYRQTLDIELQGVTDCDNVYQTHVHFYSETRSLVLVRAFSQIKRNSSCVQFTFCPVSTNWNLAAHFWQPILHVYHKIEQCFAKSDFTKFIQCHQN